MHQQPTLPTAELKRAQETYKLLLLAKEDIDEKLRIASPGFPGIENMMRNSGSVSQAENNNTGYATSTMRSIPVRLLIEIRDHMKQTHADMEKHADTLEKQILAEKTTIQELEKDLLRQTMSIVSQIDAMEPCRTPR